MPAFKINDDNDIAIENNNFVLVDGADLVKQMLKQRLQTFLGEWFLDNTVGVPYYQNILIKGVAVSTVSNILKTHIIKTPGVIKLVEFEPDYNENTRRYDLAFTVLSADGEIEINIEELF